VGWWCEIFRQLLIEAFADLICFAFWGMPILFALSMPMCQIYPGKSNAQFALEI